MGKLGKGAILSYINLALVNIIGLVLTPFIIKQLGTSQYGLYVLVGGLIGYISVMDLGINNAIIRYVSSYRASGNVLDEKKFLTTVFSIYGVISIVIVIIGSLLYLFLGEIFSKFSADDLIKLKKMFIILIFNLIVSIISGGFLAICNAYKEFVFPRLLAIIKYLSRTTLVYLFLSKTKDAMTLVWIDTFLNVLILFVALYYVLTYLKVSFYPKLKYNKTLVLDIFSYTIWIFIYSITMQFQWNFSQTAIGAVLDTKTVAVFGVGIMLSGYYSALAGVFNTLLLPKATELHNTSESYDYTDSMITYARLNVFIMFLILGGFFLYGKEFILLWIGKEYQSSWLIAILIMLASTLAIAQGFGNSILEARKKNRFRSIIYIFSVSIGIGIGFLLLKKYGVLGMMYCLSSTIFLNSIIMLLYFRKTFKLNIYRFISNIFLKQILCLLILVIVFSYVKNYVYANTWMQLGLNIILFVCGYLSLNYLFVLNKTEKSRIKIR
ncbi:oligosaccharide flippase family protein [Chryseobacterium sp. TY4]